MDDQPQPRWAERLTASRAEVLGLAILAVAALVLLAAFWRGSGGAAGTSGGAGPAPQEGPAPAVQLTGGTIVVHVTGAVRSPGVVTVVDGARVVDVVALAGGALPEADLGAVNLARLVVDGEQVLIPDRRRAADSEEDGAPSAVREDGRLDLNLATVDDLQTLSGIGPVLAARIIRHRDEHGPFSTTGDLRAVPGIGEKTFQAIADQVVV